MSKHWSDTTKWLVIVSSLLALVWIVYRFSQIISPLAIAVILAYVLNPPIRFLTTRTRLPRTLVVAFIYLALIVILSLVAVTLVPSLIQQVTSINVEFQDIIGGISLSFERPLFLFGFPIDLRDVYQDVSTALQDIISPFASRTISFLISLASGFAWFIFVLIVSFYLLKDMEKLARAAYRLVPVDYQSEVLRLGKQINIVWSAFFRSQLVLCAIVGTIVGVAMWILGVRNALILGVIAGVLEIIPNIGPTIAAMPAVLIAYFQGSTSMSLSSGWFALLIIAFYVVFQQLENNILVPRIIGRSLNLHPLVVIIGAIAGASLAGILGVFLAAPILASLRIVGEYVHCKLLDLEPCGPATATRASSSPGHVESEEAQPPPEEEGKTDAREEQGDK